MNGAYGGIRIGCITRVKKTNPLKKFLKLILDKNHGQSVGALDIHFL